MLEYPTEEWRFASPEAFGWSNERLQRASEAAGRSGSRAALVVHRGFIVACNGDFAEKHLVASVRKSLLSALIGIEVERGRIRLDATLAEMSIDDLPPGLTDRERTATVRDLLTSRSGIYLPGVAETEAVRRSKPARGSHGSGSHWCYNNWDFNALGTIYEVSAGVSVFEGFHRDIARPIGMQDFQPGDGHHMRGTESLHPAYHFRMSARDLARFGLLYLRDGHWGERRVVAPGWVRESTKAHAITPSGDGYGYMWWTTGHQGEAGNRSTAHLNQGLPTFRYFAQGYGGQMVGVMPAKELVIVNLAPRPTAKPDAEASARLAEFVRLVARAAHDC